MRRGELERKARELHELSGTLRRKLAEMADRMAQVREDLAASGRSDSGDPERVSEETDDKTSSEATSSAQGAQVEARFK